MTVTTKSGTTYDLGAEADEVLLALKVMEKDNLFQHLLTQMYAIGLKEAAKLCNGENCSATQPLKMVGIEEGLNDDI